MSPALLAATSLGHDYGHVTALQGLDLELEEGPWALLGPNGAGKTTLIRLSLGLAQPTRGSIQVMGQDPWHHGPELRARIGYMPERPAILPGLTGFRYVVLAAQMSGLDRTSARQKAHTALDHVGLDEARYRSVEGYSTGMRQRVKLAQAMVHEPGLLVLDEPTNGLDPDGREEMLSLIDDLADAGQSLIYASHILPEVRKVCDRAVVLSQGRVVHAGPLADLEVELGGLSIETLDPPGPLVEALEAAGHTVDREGDLLTVDGTTDLPQVLALAEQAGVAIRAARPERRGVHDVVVELMEGAR